MIIKNKIGLTLLLIMSITSIGLSQTTSVSGTITDVNDNSPLIGATVRVVGGSNGAISDVDGSFQISDVDPNASLMFSYLSYEDQEVEINNQTIINVQMKPDAGTNIEEIVVVGYGTQKRSSVTAAIASVPMDEIKDQPTANVATALQGKIPGVVIQQSGGAPGNNPVIKVRGVGSISAGNSPLIVVDGNIVDQAIFGLLNPSDIESIDVLKDASSTAIYGSKGSNGVILVTTKSGVPGKNVISLDVYTGTQQVQNTIDILNSQQFAEFSKEAANNAYLDNVPGASASDPNSVRPGNFLRYRYPRGEAYPELNYDNPASLGYYNYQDLIFRNAPMSSYQLTASGGGENGRYLISGGYLSQEGIVRTSDLDRYTFRANADLDISSKVKIGLNLNPTFRQEQLVNTDGHWAGNGVINSALSIVPAIPVFDPQNSGVYTSQVAYGAPYGLPGITNPVANITELKDKRNGINFLGNTYLQWDVIENLTYRATANVNYTGTRRDFYRTSRVPLNGLLPPTTATGSVNSDETLNWLFNQTVNYSKTINKIHDVDFLLGMESTKLQFESSGGGGSAFPNDVVQTLNASASGPTTTSTSFKEENTSASYFARANYNYDDKYLFNFSIRRDGSSIFGSENRWGTFPAGSFGWRLSEENFLKDVSAISEAKFRISYGLAGNNAFNSFYPYVALLSNQVYSFNNTLVSGLAPSTLANNELGWEKSNQLDIGLDFGLFDNRVNVIVDYYKRNTKDLLLSVNVPSLTGFSSVVKNIGEMENKGWEFGISTKNFVQDFIWNTNFNLSFNDNEVVALGPTGDPIISRSGVGETNITMIGEPIGSFFGYKQLGIFQNQAELDSYPHFDTSRPGDVKFEDVNKDGKLTADDRTVIGNNQPDFVYGLTNNFSYKNVDLSLSIQGSEGGEVLNLSRRFIDNLEGNANQMTTVLNRWRSEAEPGNGTTPRANARTSGSSNNISTRWVEDASFLRIQNLSIGYTLPADKLSKTKISTLRFYGSAQNLVTFTDYLGYNPEVSGYNQALSPGVDYGSFPLARTFTVGFNIGF